VPLDWKVIDLLDALKAIDSSLKDHKHQLSLYPACNTPTQTALLTLDSCSKYFRSLKPNESYYETTSVVNKSKTILTLDSHFHDLTPLNTPEGDIVAESVLGCNTPSFHVYMLTRGRYSVVAVTGLAGHAFGSWTSRKTHQMWLKDFLSKDVKNIRIMTYGYDSSLVRPETNGRLIDYRRNFIQQLENSRSSVEVCR